GKTKNRTTLRLPPEGLEDQVHALLKDPLATILKISKKEERETALSEAQAKVVEMLTTLESTYTLGQTKQAIKKVTAHHMREMILTKKVRCDGRTGTEIRDIFIDLDPLARTHGSALFTRGETQTIAVCTLGSSDMGQRYEDLDMAGVHRFFLQYSFPPFSVGEVGRMGSPGRREVGHGKLAERALQATIPDTESFPYTIRLESNITESNGSSSMASICGGCIAMMRAGVPIKRPIAGIAMGLILEGERFAILSDILGVEDALGDMDFKVAGDEKGITAFQLDIKIEGINQSIMKAALSQAKEGRLHILNKMLETCPKSSEKISQYAPKIDMMLIKPSKIGIVIGPGGKQIREIIEVTGCQIDINDDGMVSFSSQDADAIEKAKAMVYNLTADVEVGAVYEGKIVSIKDFGVFVQVLSKEGLCHISELSNTRINDPSELFKLFKMGDTLKVKVIEVNDRGQIRLSHRVLLNEGN
ncbi:MAG: polyribonucleotide nucleotidyltransferase, partial [Simkaniaceae bacterium]|nr:polyribonucleotide nucleotidyltransferase [Simkaniaceae bacterium]